MWFCNEKIGKLVSIFENVVWEKLFLFYFSHACTRVHTLAHARTQIWKIENLWEKSTKINFAHACTQLCTLAHVCARVVEKFPIRSLQRFLADFLPISYKSTVIQVIFPYRFGPRTFLTKFPNLTDLGARISENLI